MPPILFRIGCAIVALALAFLLLSVWALMRSAAMAEREATRQVTEPGPTTHCATDYRASRKRRVVQIEGNRGAARLPGDGGCPSREPDVGD